MRRVSPIDFGVVVIVWGCVASLIVWSLRICRIGG